jgi:hypothetical protein
MNSEDQTAPPQGVAVVNTPEGVQQRNAKPTRGSRRRRRGRNRNRNRNRPQPPTAQSTRGHTVPEEERPPVTDGTQLHQARRNHSTFDRALHHRGRGGTGYGYRQDLQQPPSELQGDQLPPGVLPSYAHILTRIRLLAQQQGETMPEDAVYDRLFGTRPAPDTAQVHQDTPAQQQAREEQWAREAHERDQHTAPQPPPTESLRWQAELEPIEHAPTDQELKG